MKVSGELLRRSAPARFREGNNILTGTGPDGFRYAVKSCGVVVRGEDDLRIPLGRGHGNKTFSQVGDHYNHATLVMRIRGYHKFVAPVGRGGGPVRDPSSELAPRRAPRRASQTRVRRTNVPWTIDEDATLAREHTAFPSDWARIARLPPAVTRLPSKNAGLAPCDTVLQRGNRRSRHRAPRAHRAPP